MKLKIIIIGICFLLCTGCKTFIAGSPVESFKNMTSKDVACMVAGATCRFIVHETGHFIALELTDTDYSFHQRGFGAEFTYTGVSDSETRWISRAGFISQIGFDFLFLRNSESYFSLGYKISNTFSILAYPFLFPDKGDLYEIDKHGGNATLEWVAYSILSGYNLFKIEW